MTVITVSGCYGTGTSTAAEHIADYYESEYNETTNVVDIRGYIKSRYEIVNDTDIANWETYREWAQTVRSKYDAGVFASRIAETWDIDHANLVVCGLNSPKQVQNLNWYFGSNNISMWTLPDVRYERMHGKKPHSEDKQWPLFKERQQYEVNERNSAELLSNESYYDFILQNNGGTDILKERSETIVDAIVNEDNTCYLRNNPFPSKEDRVIKQYI